MEKTAAQKMNLLQKYLTDIENSKVRTHVVIGSDALFVTLRRTETAIDLKRSFQKRKRYRVSVVLVLSAHGVQRLEPIHHNYQRHVDSIVSKLKYGSIDSQSSLLGAMSKFSTGYGVLCLKLTPTKLERYL